MIKDFHDLPRLKDSISYIYVEHAAINQNNTAVVIAEGDGYTQIPIANMVCLMLGPGTSITHAAIRTICENGCMIVWCGENVQRFYAAGMGETRNAKNLLMQASACMDQEKHAIVAKRMYEIRFPKLPDREYTIQQLRGMEGIRVREAYKLASRRTGVAWKNRSYKTEEWDEADPINKALSAANAVLYSVCHGAIVSLGFSPGLGFVHTGKMLSFVYDIADLYKADTTIPAAFEAVHRGTFELEKNVRMICRRKFEQIQLLKKIPKDIAQLLDFRMEDQESSPDTGDLWDDTGTVRGGKNYGIGTGDDSNFD